MSGNLFTILDWITNLFQSVLLIITGFLCFPVKPGKMGKTAVMVLSTILLFGVITAVNAFFFFEGFAIFGYAAVLFLLLFTFGKGSIGGKTYFSIFGVYAAAVGSILSTNLIAFILGSPVADYYANSMLWHITALLLSNLIFAGLMFSVTALIVKKKPELPLRDWLLLSVQFVLSMAAYTVLYSAMLSKQSVQEGVTEYFCICIIVFLNLGSSYLLVNSSSRARVELENILLKKQIELQNASILDANSRYEELRKVRHDFFNALGVIGQLNREGKYEQAEQYIEQYVAVHSSPVSVIDTGNAIVNALIRTKSAEAEKKVISLTISSSYGLDEKYGMDLCSLLGNLFDNAIRAADQCTSKKIFLTIVKEERSLVINMKNTIRESVLTWNPELHSDKTDREWHGCGVGIIRDVAEKYNGFVDYYEEDKLFCCNVILYMDE